MLNTWNPGGEKPGCQKGSGEGKVLQLLHQTAAGREGKDVLDQTPEGGLDKRTLGFCKRKGTVSFSVVKECHFDGV